MARWLVLGLWVGLSAGCGDSSAQESAPPHENESEAAPYACNRQHTCHDYNVLPTSSPDGLLTVRAARDECADGDFIEGGCNIGGAVASCSMSHVVILYRSGADLGAAEQTCRAENGIWDGE